MNPKFKRRRLVAWIPTALTLGNLAFGFIVIWTALSQHERFLEKDSAKLFSLLGTLLLISCLCDFLDGFTARKLQVTTPLGIELDSLADLVSFGVAPVVIFYACLFDAKPTLTSFLACLVYILAGAFRLARFNQSALDSRGPSAHFDGLPITGASIFWVAALFFLGQEPGNTIFENHENGLRVTTLFIFAVLGVLMVSHFPYRSLKIPLKKTAHWRRNALALTLLCLLAIRRLGADVMLMVIPMVYIFGTPLITISQKIRRRAGAIYLRHRPL
ncbi:MAG: CDP-alcohol phosphatidyltransferase family protein [Elusimicrobia bacterium]|nr:CDP-alcohol phosphatidyltransferase family protein [Elusimicrobiota bacterium]